MTMSCSTETQTTGSKASPVLDLTTTLPSELRSHTPVGVAEALSRELGDASWLLVDSNVMASGDEAMSLRMLLERASSQGVSIALDLNWQPPTPPESPPTAEVLRRFRTLAEAAALIRATEQEAEWFFQSTDPVSIHEALPQRPAVLVGDRTGPVRWCLGGRSGSLQAVVDGDAFLSQLIDGLRRHPALLGRSGPGLDAVAQPDPLAELLRSAAEPPPAGR